MNKVELGSRRYLVELGGATVLFMAAMSARKSLASSLEPGWLRDGAILLPIVPICLAAWAIVRFYGHTDEMHRRVMLENIAFGALVCAVGSLSLDLLHGAGVPIVPIGWAWALMASGWLLITAWRGLQNVIANGGE